MADMQRRVERQTRIRSKHAVALGGELGVVPGTEALELSPADPAGGERTLVARCLELGSSVGDLGPGFGWLFRVQPGSLEGILVVVENGRGAVKWEAQHLAVWRCVVTRDSRYVGIGVELDACLFHDIRDRHDRPFAGHHGGRADFKHLNDVRRIASTESGNRGRHRLVITALERWDDFVFFLAFVEILGEVIDPFTKCTTH